jgi:hypothetical protein
MIKVDNKFENSYHQIQTEMADPCLISKEQLSQKEISLKSRLYGIQPT